MIVYYDMFCRYVMWVLVWLTFFLPSIRAQGVTTTAPSSTTEGSNIVVNTAVTSVGLLAGIIIISLVIAKILDHCYDRASIRDDASDISEHTRKLIRARLALNKFKKPIQKKKKKSEKETKEKTVKVLRMWSTKAKSKAARRTDNIITVEEVKDDNSLRLNDDLQRVPSKVKFIDEINGPDSNDLTTPVFTITVPELKPQQVKIPSKSDTSEKYPEVPLLASVAQHPESPVQAQSELLKQSTETISGRTTPSKEPPKGSPINAGKGTAGKTSPGHSSPTKTTPDKNDKRQSSIRGRSTPASVISGRQSPQRDVTKSVPKKSTTSKSDHNSPLSTQTKTRQVTSAKSQSFKDLAKNRSPSPPRHVSPSSRPQTAPSSRPNSKVLKVKSAQIRTPSPYTKPTIKGSPEKKTSGRSDSTDRNTSRSDTTGSPPLRSRTALGLHTNPDDDARGDIQKKFVHFRGDSDDLLIPVSTDQQPTTVPMSYERGRNTSSSEDYEFLDSDSRGSPGVNNNARI